MEKEQAVSSGSSWLLPAALSMTAGAVDVIGFLAVGGLFTAHITGNLVVLLAHYITRNFGEIGPLLAVPIFIVVLGVVTLTFIRKPAQVTVDLARLLRGQVEDNERRIVRHRADATLFAVIGFLIGLAVGAVLEMHFGFWSLIFPAILAAASIPIGECWPSHT
jgi:uncharacterized membrane protein YoaK (UPF0700 family)